jgi:preprotein translocase subunit SecA
VLNDQRKVVFEQRLDIMRSDDVSEVVAEMRTQVIDDTVARHIPERAYAEQWDAAGLQEEINGTFGLSFRSSNGPRKKALPRKR